MGVPRINAAWTALSKADFLLWQTAPYVRRTTPKLFKFNGPGYKVDALVPFGDNLLRSFQIEQLIQLVLRSCLRERLLEGDALNTYEKANLEYPLPGTYWNADDLPATTRLNAFSTPQSFLQAGKGDITFNCTVDPGALTCTVDNTRVETFTYANNLTSRIELLPGFEIQFKGDIGGSPFTFLVNFVTDPAVNWRETLARAQNVSWRWNDPELREIAEQDPLWTNKLAAYVVSAIEDNLDA